MVRPRLVRTMESTMPDTHYAILRVQRVKSRSDLHAATRHGRREDAGQHYDPERTPFNRHWSACPVLGPVDWATGVDAAVTRMGAECRKGAAVAAELFVGASSAFFDPPAGANAPFDMAKVTAWEEATMSALYERFGERVVAARLDLDEGSPHMAICVLPTYTKTTKHKRTTVVSYRKVFGGENRQEARETLIELQDWYAAKMAPLGLSRGVPKAVTGRTHLTHQEYARRRRQEDEARAEALRKAEHLAEAIARREAMLAQKLERVQAIEEATMNALRNATRILLDAEKAHAWIIEQANAFAELQPNSPVARLLADKVAAMEKYREHIEELTTELANVDEPSYGANGMKI